MSDDSISETRLIYHRAFIVNSTSFLLSFLLVVGSVLADHMLVAPYVHLADNVGLTASRLIGHSLVRLGWISSAISMVGVLLCYPLRYPRGPQDGAQLRRCAVVHSAGSIGVLFVLVLAMIFLCVLLYQVTSSQHLLDLAMHTYADLFPVRYAFDAMQSNFRCCGSDGAEDWLRIHWTNRTEIARGLAIGVPPSCCTITTHQGCVSAVPAGTAWNMRLLTVHKIGCAQLLKTRFRAVLLSGILLLLTLIAMYASTIVQTIRTAPAIDHEASKSTEVQHGISHAELGHIVVRSLAGRGPPLGESSRRQPTTPSSSTSVHVLKDKSGQIGNEHHHGDTLLKSDSRRKKDRSRKGDKRNVPVLSALNPAFIHDQRPHYSPVSPVNPVNPPSRLSSSASASIQPTTTNILRPEPVLTEAAIPYADVISHGPEVRDARHQGTGFFPAVQHPIYPVAASAVSSGPHVVDSHQPNSVAATAGSALRGGGGGGSSVQVASLVDGSGSKTASLPSASSSLPLGATASTLLPLLAHQQTTKTDSTTKRTDHHDVGDAHKEDTGDTKDGGGQRVTSPGRAYGRVEFASDVDVAGSSVDRLPSASLKQAAAAKQAAKLR